MRRGLLLIGAGALRIAAFMVCPIQILVWAASSHSMVTQWLSLTLSLEHVKLDEMAIRTAAIILLFSVLIVFFVPAGVGPFSAVYGPATALRANRAAHVFYVNLALSARCPIAVGMFSLAAQWLPRSHAFLIAIHQSPGSPLRC